jgi:hypothetical protein
VPSPRCQATTPRASRQQMSGCGGGVRTGARAAPPPAATGTAMAFEFATPRRGNLGAAGAVSVPAAMRGDRSGVGGGDYRPYSITQRTIDRYVYICLDMATHLRIVST